MPFTLLLCQLGQHIYNAFGHRDVLRRFYIDGQPKERICREMRLTNTQFALLKSRAKARVAKRYSRLAALNAA